jgi:hypothetical protein
MTRVESNFHPNCCCDACIQERRKGATRAAARGAGGGGRGVAEGGALSGQRGPGGVEREWRVPSAMVSGVWKKCEKLLKKKKVVKFFGTGI